MHRNQVEALLNSRERLLAGQAASADRSRLARRGAAAEGGCGVLGLAANIPVAGRHLLAASRQMHNRGNGKGGGIAAAGLDPVQMRVSQEVLRSHYLLQIAYIDPGSRVAVERECVENRFDVAQAYSVESVGESRSQAGLEVPPPEVARYFCRVKPEMLARFAEQNALRHVPARAVEDEFVYQNSYRLNQRFYSSAGQKRAFVASHGRDMLVLKIVGYAEQVVEHYQLGEMTAHVWIAHQRYPTRGRVWHPAGAHPFVGMNEALVHNGDFANYHRVTEYLRHRNIVPLFLTDTEVSVLLFDLWDRIYEYPLEVIIEAFAPTRERDFDQLPPEKKTLYRAIQQTHLHGSPDGPWFFIIARSHPDRGAWQLLGITDTSMLRPQVFALCQSSEAPRVQLGLIASERQAINACLRSLAAEDSRILPVADRYWNARGGSHTDGGAFAFTVTADAGGANLECRDKFGRAVTIPPRPTRAGTAEISAVGSDAAAWFQQARGPLTATTLAGLAAWGETLVAASRRDDASRAAAIAALLLVRDRRFDPGGKTRAATIAAVDRALFGVLRAAPGLRDGGAWQYRRVDRATRETLRPPEGDEQVLVIDARDCPPEGSDSAAQLIVRGAQRGWRSFVAFDWRGGRFAGCGLGPDSTGIRIDIVGDPGDYLGSGLDGGEITVHGDTQDQVGQILKCGRLVIHGDVGQTFLYGAKGGTIFVLGSAAGRPLINAVGRPRVVINGTCLDYLAESFMAGDPIQGGGFAVVNGLAFDDEGCIHDLETPYPGGNLFSLASGGAIYLRDPRGVVDEDQLNGGRLTRLTDADWTLIEPYLRENESLFGIPLDRLLSHEGLRRSPDTIYRKVEVAQLAVFH